MARSRYRPSAKVREMCCDKWMHCIHSSGFFAGRRQPTNVWDDAIDKGLAPPSMRAGVDDGLAGL